MFRLHEHTNKTSIIVLSKLLLYTILKATFDVKSYKKALLKMSMRKEF